MPLPAEIRRGLTEFVARRNATPSDGTIKHPDSDRKTENVRISRRTLLVGTAGLTTLGVAELSVVSVFARILQSVKVKEETVQAASDKGTTLDTTNLNCQQTTCFKQYCPDPNPSLTSLSKYSQECQDLYHRLYPG